MALVRPTQPGAQAQDSTRPVVTLPQDDEFRSMLTDLLGRRSAVQREFGVRSVPEVGELAFFVDDEGTLAAMAFAELGLAAATAGALALMPPDSVAAALEAGTLDAMARDNYYEVINILSSMLNGNADRHVRLTTTHPIGASTEHNVEDTLAAARDTWFYNVDIDGYGSGLFAFVAV